MKLITSKIQENTSWKKGRTSSNKKKKLYEEEKKLCVRNKETRNRSLSLFLSTTYTNFYSLITRYNEGINEKDKLNYLTAVRKHQTIKLSKKLT